LPTFWALYLNTSSRFVNCNMLSTLAARELNVHNQSPSFRYLCCSTCIFLKRVQIRIKFRQSLTIESELCGCLRKGRGANKPTSAPAPKARLVFAYLNCGLGILPNPLPYSSAQILSSPPARWIMLANVEDELVVSHFNSHLLVPFSPNICSVGVIVYYFSIIRVQSSPARLTNSCG